MKTVSAAPRAAALIEGMRDFGYSLETALADVIDNSITAGCSYVEIHSDMFVDTPVIAIVDDGCGMSESELHEALRPGSKNPREKRDERDLGRFGLGLKTASYSQCRCLTVAARADGKTSIARWNLDRVAEEDEWLLEIPDEDEEIPFLNELGEHGTLVIWQSLDRLLGDEPDEAAKSNANRSISAALNHLELVFHRFISGDTGIRKVTMLANGQHLEAMDPFRSNYRATIVGPVEHIRFKKEIIEVQAFTLPHHSKVTPAQWRRYGGAEGYLRNQGFYVYRSGRLIIHGTWFGLARQQELTKLCRVRIDLPNSLDSDWKIDVKKASAQPPRAIRDRLRTLIETIGIASKRVYTHKGARLIESNPMPVWSRLQKDGQIRFSVNRDHPVVVEAIENPSPKSLADVIAIIEGALPLDALLADLGNEPESVEAAEVDRTTMETSIRTTLVKLRQIKLNQEEIAAYFAVAEPFRSNPGVTSEILEELNSKKRKSKT